MSIQKLPWLLINQIAAGEVIERPASVVKELVENSLDAGATRLEITVEDGGRQLIRISDNGRGIAPNELHLAVAPHATSKLMNPDQLATVGTFGFRGEALASIASVSRLRITSRVTMDGVVADAGAVIEAEGDHVGESSPAACSPGTTIEVRDLFFNTPARRRFMRGASTEIGHITETITRIAIVHSAVAFKLTHGSRTTLDVSLNQSRRQRCMAMLGEELNDAFLEFESARLPSITTDTPQADAQIRLWGLAGLPSIARSTSKFQYLCVNGRPIRDRRVSHAIKEAYRGLMPSDKQPVVVLFIDLDPSAVDVNVHPTKAEVRFHDAARIHGLVLSTLRQRLLGSDLTPSATLGQSTSPTKQPVNSATDQLHRQEVDRPMTSSRDAAITPAPEANFSEFVDYFRQRSTPQKGFDFDEIKQAMAKDLPIKDDATNPPVREGSTSGGNSSTNDSDVSSSNDTVKPQTNPTSGDGQLSQGVLQVHDSYLVTEDEQGLIIIDQHALHERVMFEHLRRRILGPDQQTPRNLESQRLLVPAVVKATPKRVALLEDLKPLMNRIGIDAAALGPDTLAVHAFPSFLFDRHVDPVEFVEELLDIAEEGELVLETSTSKRSNHIDGVDVSNDMDQTCVEEAVLHKVLDMMACKAAVKAGDRMSTEELNDLLSQRHEVERASSCPHGRPTTIRITLRDMEKQFKRT